MTFPRGPREHGPWWGGGSFVVRSSEVVRETFAQRGIPVAIVAGFLVQVGVPLSATGKPLGGPCRDRESV